MTKTMEQWRQELSERPLRSIKDYIEKDVVLPASPEMRTIDEVVLMDGSRVPGKNLEHCFEEMLMARDRTNGHVTYIPYTAIVKIIGTDKA